MDHRTAFVAWSSVSALAGFTLALLVLPTLTAARAVTSAPFPLETATICRIPPDDSARPFYAEVDAANARMHDAMNVTPAGDIDRDFARLMIPHHQGAIDMAHALLKYGRDEKLRRLAQSIVIEQDQEITYMRALLDASSPVSTAAASDAQP